MKPWFATALAILLAYGVCACPEDKTKAIAASKIAYDLGVNHLNSNQVRQALDQFLKAVESNPEFPEAHNALGLLYFGIRDFDKAELHFKKAIDLKPDFSDAANNLGRLYLEKEDYDRAIEMFKKALSDMIYPTPQFATGNLGWALYKKGKTKEALEQFRKAVLLDPKFCLGHRWIGMILHETGEGLEARRGIEKFKEACPSEPEAHYRLAEVKHRFKLAPLADVMADLERSLEFNPSFCPSLLFVGRLHDEAMKYKEAAAALEKYFDACQDLTDAEAYLLTGTIYYKLDQQEKAAAYFGTCVKRWPDTVPGRACAELLAKTPPK
ncbi:MAG: tetratricopeptide repeat protein [Deltaproteobacteria bacterium]|nr:tetratricopeptide repeat protein [Deltaproteobacteria bacterium]